MNKDRVMFPEYSFFIRVNFTTRVSRLPDVCLLIAWFPALIQAKQLLRNRLAVSG